MRSSAAFYIFEAKLKQKKLIVKFFATKKCCMLHFLQRKNVVCYTFYNEKMLNVTLFTAKKRDGVHIILD